MNEQPSIGNVKKVFEIMRTKLSLAVDASPDEFSHNNTPNKFTVLMLLDKLYSIFKHHQLIDNEDMMPTRRHSATIDNNDENWLKPKDPVIKVSLKRKLAQDGSTTTASSAAAAAARFTLFPNSTVTTAATSSRQRKSLNLGDQITSVFKNKIDFFNNNNKQEVTQQQQQQPVTKQSPPKIQQSSGGSNGPLTLCYMCNEKVFLMERQTVLDCTMHATCFRCSYCSRLLRNGYYNYSKNPLEPNSKCKKKFKLL